MFKRKIEFTDNFTSPNPMIGNVWHGRQLLVDKKLAEAMVKAGRARFVKAKGDE